MENPVPGSYYWGERRSRSNKNDTANLVCPAAAENGSCVPRKTPALETETAGAGCG